MKNQYVKTPITLIGSKSYIKYEAKGVVLIITPWNFPINLIIHITNKCDISRKFSLNKTIRNYI